MADVVEKRVYVRREKPYLEAFVAKQFPGREVHYQMKLGPTMQATTVSDQPPFVRRSLVVFNRKADAVIFLDDSVLIIEAKIRPRPADISQMQYYLKIAPATADETRLVTANLRGMLLWPLDDAILHQWARNQGIEVTVWMPPEPIRGLLFPRLNTMARHVGAGYTPEILVR